MRPSRLIRSAIVVTPSTLLSLHRALIQRKYRRLFSSKGSTKPGPKGPSQDVIAAVVDMKQRNPTWGCPRIAHQINLAFGIRATHSRSPVRAKTRLSGAVLAHRTWAREGQSMESGSVSVRIGHPPYTLGARGDGPLHAAHRGLRRASRRRRWRGAVPDVQSSEGSSSGAGLVLRNNTCCAHITRFTRQCVPSDIHDATLRGSEW